MTHFTKEEWQQYQNAVLDEVKMKIMEDHLYDCENCMQIFLSTIDEKEVELAADIMDKDFCDKTMSALFPQPVRLAKTKAKTKAKSNNIKNIFAYYTAAAALTLFFVGGGVFQSMVDNYSSISQIAQADISQVKQNSEVNLSVQIADKTSKWIEKFENGN